MAWTMQFTAEKVKPHEERAVVMKKQNVFFKAFGAAIAIGSLLIANPAVAGSKGGKSLFDRLGGIFAVASVVDHFSDALINNPVVGKTSANAQLREWHNNSLDRLAGLKFMRTLWVCDKAGGPCKFTPTKPGSTTLGLEESHRELKISPAEFDEVAAELGRSLDFFNVPQKEKDEVLAAFAAHKNEVTAGFRGTRR